MFAKYYPEATHIVIDSNRNTVNISATELRTNLYKHWQHLPNCVRSFFVKKIAIVGTESTGKSMLSSALAKFYNTNFIPEVGRSYCEMYKNQLTPTMFDSIAMEHFILQEKSLPKSNKLMIVDSDAIITKYYLDMYCNQQSPLIEEIIKKQEYDLCLFLEPDVQWVADGYRFSGDDKERQANNIKLKQLYESHGVKCVYINGNYSDRFFNARTAINKLDLY